MIDTPALVYANCRRDRAGEILTDVLQQGFSKQFPALPPYLLDL
jgi:hypothetical protein